MPATIYCTRCWTGYQFFTEWPAKCPACDRVVRWATQSMMDAPKVPYDLSHKDQTLLHALRIDPEVAEG